MKRPIFLKAILIFMANIVFALTAVFCPVCDKQYQAFLPFGIVKRERAKCPGCGLLERHRHLWLFLETQNIFSNKSIRLLHWAPEPALYKKFRSLQNIDYTPVDIDPVRYRKLSIEVTKMDITAIEWQDNYFDGTICSHVLEHIIDDRTAMKELARVLKPGGWAIIIVPLYYDLPVTFEDPTIVHPKDRLKYFDQEDHVRKYGFDIKKRLEEAGFIVTIHLLSAISHDIRKTYGLDGYDRQASINAARGADIIFCIKKGTVNEAKDSCSTSISNRNVIT